MDFFSGFLFILNLFQVDVEKGFYFYSMVPVLFCRLDQSGLFSSKMLISPGVVSCVLLYTYRETGFSLFQGAVSTILLGGLPLSKGMSFYYQKDMLC